MKTQIINGDSYFKIADVHQMRPFMMSVVSNGNHWLFVTSNGGITAGRRDSNFALFPYETDDRLIDGTANTGSKTIIRCKLDDTEHLWEPFNGEVPEDGGIRRNLYKSVAGNKIIFEEIHEGLQLVFQYAWNTSNKYGFVRTASLKSHNPKAIEVQVLDGFQNLLPYGVGADLQSKTSNLADAYKRCERPEGGSLAIYSLSAIIVDKAEPSEALKANVVWSIGLQNATYLLCSRQLHAFKYGKPVTTETDIKAEKGAYFTISTHQLNPDGKAEWMMVANVNHTQRQVIGLMEELNNETILKEAILKDVEDGSQALLKLLASADGLQCSADYRWDARHQSNVLFNIMRGGVFHDGYHVAKHDWQAYIKTANQSIATELQADASLEAANLDYQKLRAWAIGKNNADLVRHTTEYLPLKFSRRHGDPSRPWNRFTINTNSEIDGSDILDYEGNWRDIFQNWEALAHSYPQFTDGMIFRFLNASTFDGYNPYRITRAGIDWESIEPDDPWSYIGYWGDHQIIYLLKFLEFKQGVAPEDLRQWTDKDWFAYAHVPYRIKTYADIVKNPKDTIDFDGPLDHQLRKAMADQGSDAALMTQPQGGILHISFTEKLLATGLAKITNLIPDAGIWMNTQRPEWNDANNALVGNGVSVVTLGYLHRFFKFVATLFEEAQWQQVALSEEFADLLTTVTNTLQQYEPQLLNGFDAASRKSFADTLGEAASQYRQVIYTNGFSGNKKDVSKEFITTCCDWCVRFSAASISANKRSDGLFHAYNLLTIRKDGMHIGRLDLMLEGQVAALSAQVLQPNEACQLLEALRHSAIYREDQRSYLLYPNKALPGFLEKNNIPADLVASSPLLQHMLQQGDRSIIEQDARGQIHFNASFRNAGDLRQKLDKIEHQPEGLVTSESLERVEEIYEQVFNHKAFTGRSGTFFAYEGLGSIYWHMVSKLHLAVAEVLEDVLSNQTADEATTNCLKHHFAAIGEGIGMHKTAEEYGAFPTDPYSHTPWHRGAQQPGMTGQVKEDILVRWIVLGVGVKGGCLQFRPRIVQKSDFLQAARTMHWIDMAGDVKSFDVPAGRLFFTYCQVPIVYTLGEQETTTVHYANGTSHAHTGNTLNATDTSSVIARNGLIGWIEVQVPAGALSSN